MKITYLIRTNSLDADERFVKTLFFLSRLGGKTEVFAIVNTLSSQSKRYAEEQLAFRRIFPSGGMVALKALEMLLRASLYLLTHRGRRWYANFDFLPLHVLTAAFASESRRPIWDLHEMPATRIMRSRVLRWVFAFLLRGSHVIVCNDARRRALEESFGVDLSDALVLHNYPSLKGYEALETGRKRYLETADSRRDIEQIVLIGGHMPNRYVPQATGVINKLREETGRDLRLSIVGGKALEGAEAFVTCTGFIPFTQLIERCVEGGISLCFYARTSLNNTLCEPNRFYQGIAAGQYVVTFDHPSLNDAGYPYHVVIDEEHFAESLRAALLTLLEDHVPPHKRLATISSQDGFVFEEQYPAFADWYPD